MLNSKIMKGSRRGGGRGGGGEEEEEKEEKGEGNYEDKSANNGDDDDQNDDDFNPNRDDNDRCADRTSWSGCRHCTRAACSICSPPRWSSSPRGFWSSSRSTGKDGDGNDEFIRRRLRRRIMPKSTWRCWRWR